MISDEVLAMFELSNDLLYNKIPAGRHGFYVRESLRLGREAARRLAGSEDGRAEGPAGITDAIAEKLAARPLCDIGQFYAKAGITITYQDKSGQNYGVSFRAQSEYGKDGSAQVVIYRGSIKDLADHSDVSLLEGGEQIPGLDEDTALNVHLAHEYFHYLEFQSSDKKDGETMKYYDSGFVSDCLEQVELTRILKWRRTAGILRTSEIAAHAFAKELLGLPVLPNYYDYTYLLAVKKIRREDFQARVKEYQEMV